MTLLTAILGGLASLATIAGIAQIYIPKLVAAIQNLAEAIHNSNAIATQKAAGEKAESTGDTSDLEKPLHSGSI